MSKKRHIARFHTNLLVKKAEIPDPEGRIKKDSHVKHIVRSFRAFIKSLYLDDNRRRYYYWVNNTLRENMRSFYSGDKFQISSTEYSQHEKVLIQLVHNTKTPKELAGICGEFEEQDHKNHVMFKELFG